MATPCARTRGTRSFNSRSRMGSDEAAITPAHRGGVSIHAPAWGATAAPSHDAPPRKFQFTLPHGERPRAWVEAGGRLAFQFTLPHGERRISRCSSSWSRCFNSRSRMGSDCARRCRWPSRRGFNSRSRMGSDRQGQGQGQGARRFNSRSRMGSDRGHPPRLNRGNRFNSRSRMGSDRHPQRPAASHRPFQFTLPHGERPRSSRGTSAPGGFNSRSRMGSDLQASALLPIVLCVSIHAPAWGATPRRRARAPS